MCVAVAARVNLIISSTVVPLCKAYKCSELLRVYASQRDCMEIETAPVKSTFGRKKSEETTYANYNR